MAGITLLAVPVTNGPAVRAVSVVVLAVAATLWLRDTLELMRFVVAIMGRLPIVTPVYVYSVLALACGVMVGPPFIAATAATRPLRRPSLVTAALLVAVVIAAGLAYAAPAYTYAQPLRRHARVLVDSGATSATYEVGFRRARPRSRHRRACRLASGRGHAVGQRALGSLRPSVRLSNDGSGAAGTSRRLRLCGHARRGRQRARR